MHRLLERLDGAASTIVPLLYLAGLALGAASYFAGVTVDGKNAGLAVGVALAVAAELHSFLQQRRVRANWGQLQRLGSEAPEREALELQLKVNTAILAALLAFSAFNATAFVAATWRPAPGFLPSWVQIGIRGLVIPVFFFLAGYLAPLHTDASEQLRATSMDMLRRTLKAIGKQWKQRLAHAQKRNADLAPIAIALLEDVGDTDGARRVQLIAAGLDATTTTNATTTIASGQREAGLAYASAGARNAPPIPPIRDAKVAAIVAAAGGYEGGTGHTYDPTSSAIVVPLEATDGHPTAPHGGAGVVAATRADASDVPEEDPDHDPSPPDDRRSLRSDRRRSQAARGAALNVTPIMRRSGGMGRPPRRDRRVVNRENAHSGRRGNAEARIRSALASRPALTDEQLARVADVSSSTVSKWRRVIATEQRQAQA